MHDHPEKLAQVLPVVNKARVMLPLILFNIRTAMVTLPWEGFPMEVVLKGKTHRGKVSLTAVPA